MTDKQEITSYFQHVEGTASGLDFCSNLNYPLCSNLGRMTSVLSVSCRCVSCTQCGATTPGLRCDWQNNYTQCAPCASLATCPICLVDYNEGTVIVQCRQCDRYAVFLQNLSTKENWLANFLDIMGSHLNLFFCLQMVSCLLSGSPFRRRCRESCRKQL